MRRKEDISRSYKLRAVLTVTLILLGLITYILPGRGVWWTGILGLPLLLAILGGVFCGAVSGALVGALVPLLACLVLKQLDLMPDAIADICAYTAAGITAGLFYGKFRTGLGAAFGAALFSLPVRGLALVILHILMTTSYTLQDFWEEEIIAAHPSLILPLLVTPLLVLLFRKNGVMEELRGEQKE